MDTGASAAVATQLSAHSVGSSQTSMHFLPSTTSQRIALLLVSVFFCFAGISHFTNPDFFVAIVPPYLPAPLALVYVSGVFEILGGLGMVLPQTRRVAGYGLLALLVAVYPANIHMALNPDQFPDISPAALYARLPMQFVFAAAVWWATRPERANAQQKRGG